MFQKRVCLSLSLAVFALALSAAPAKAEFHYYDGGPMTTPKIGDPGQYSAPSYGSSAPSPAYDAPIPMASPSYGVQSMQQMPYAAPAQTSSRPEASSSPNYAASVLPKAKRNMVDRAYDNVMKWSAESVGGARDVNAPGPNGLPRNMIMTTQDKKDAGIK